MRRSVKKALDHWVVEGLLSADQVAQLAASLEGRDRTDDSGRAVAIFGTIGAVLSGLGVILFVGSNWAFMSPLARSAFLLAGYGFVVACAWLAEKRGLVLVADAVWLLATLVLGANIFLFAQTYNLSLTLWQGTLAWMVGALAMGYARQSTAQAAVAVPLGLLTLGWAGGGAGWFADDQVEFLFSDAGLRPVLPIFGLALIAASTLLAQRDDLRFAQAPCFRWGTFVVAASLILSTVHVDFAAAFYAADFTVKQIMVIVAAAALVIAAYFRGRIDSVWSPIVMAATLVGMAVMLIPSGDGPWVGLALEGGLHLLFGLYVLVVFGLAVLTIWLGIHARNPRLVNVGMTATALLIVIQYFGWSFELLDRSLAFVVGGVVLIGLSVAVEHQRRRLMAQITGPPAPGPAGAAAAEIAGPAAEIAGQGGSR